MSSKKNSNRSTYFTFTFLSTLALIAIVIWVNICSGLSSDLEISFLDVGQGDAVLIQTPDQKQVLIDGGPDDSVLEGLGARMASLDRTLDLVVLTHPDSDHVFGLIPVLERYEVDHVLHNFLPEHDTAVYDSWQQKINEEGAQVIQAKEGMRIDLSGDIWLEVYASSELEISPNDNSVVLKLMRADDCLAFLPGDVEAKEEQELLAAGFGVECTILKSPHHGSGTSSTPELLANIAPEAIVISVGADNKYGHPSQEVLSSYGSIPVYRTDEIGWIDVLFADAAYEISTEK